MSTSLLDVDVKVASLFVFLFDPFCPDDDSDDVDPVPSSCPSSDLDGKEDEEGLDEEEKKRR